jgi:hypothetical protein
MCCVLHRAVCWALAITADDAAAAAWRWECSRRPACVHNQLRLAQADGPESSSFDHVVVRHAPAQNKHKQKTKTPAPTRVGFTRIQTSIGVIASSHSGDRSMLIFYL